MSNQQIAPADNPRLAILVMLDEPQVQIRFGGTISAPVAQKILASSLPYLGVEPKYTEEELKTMSRTTPTLEGDKVTAAQAKLVNSNLNGKVVGSGETVLRQVPAAGEPIPKEGLVVLYTEEAAAGQTVKVPDFKGKNLNEANKEAADAGVNIQFSGVGLESGEAKASEQSIAPGTEVPLGTVVTITFRYEDNIE